MIKGKDKGHHFIAKLPSQIAEDTQDDLGRTVIEVVNTNQTEEEENRLLHRSECFMSYSEPPVHRYCWENEVVGFITSQQTNPPTPIQSVVTRSLTRGCRFSLPPEGDLRVLKIWCKTVAFFHPLKRGNCYRFPYCTGTV
jgi:hypothetical protein